MKHASASLHVRLEGGANRIDDLCVRPPRPAVKRPVHGARRVRWRARSLPGAVQDTSIGRMAMAVQPLSFRIDSTRPSSVHDSELPSRVRPCGRGRTGSSGAAVRSAVVVNAIAAGADPGDALEFRAGSQRLEREPGTVRPIAR